MTRPERTILDIHILQTVPPSNINRDDTGMPKTATYGGVRRARVSSQAWKRATREAFTSLLDASELGVRTRKVASALAERITALNSTVSDADALQLAAETLRTATGTKIETPKAKAKDKDAGEGEADPESSYLLFLSARQLDALAELALEGTRGTGELETLKNFLKTKENKARAQQSVNTRHSVDIALFGRMVADGADLNVDASAQVAHALSVHAVENESDYFTAVDDRNKADERGAGMIGIIDFNSSTLYRYAAVDVDRLFENLGAGLREDESTAAPTRQAVEAFLEAFLTSLPTGKTNTFANHTLPSAAVVKLRAGRPVNFVGAFEEPVIQDERGGHLRLACEQLAQHVQEVEKSYELDPDAPSWVFRTGTHTRALAPLGEEVGRTELLSNVGQAVQERMERRA